MPVVTFDSSPAVVRGKIADRPIECPRFSGIVASRITWTTGVLRADTNGHTGITRCGNTSARTTKQTWSDRIADNGKESHRRGRLRVECVLCAGKNKILSTLFLP